MKHSARLLTAGLGLLLSACTVVGPDYQLPKDAAVNRADLQGDLAGESANVVSAPVPADWWKLYNDPRLDALVSQALASSTDLRVAAANLQRARYQTNEAQEAGGFTNSAKAGAQRLQEAGQAFLLPEKVPVANIGDVGLTTSYQFDLFGVLQRGIEASEANADAAQAAARDYSEPLHWEDTAEQLEAFEAAVLAAGLQCLRGGRFVHVLGRTDKGKAARALLDAVGLTRCPMIALGDAGNDEALIAAADVGVWVRSPRGSAPPTQARRLTLHTRALAPSGWTEGVNAALNACIGDDRESARGIA